MLHGGQRRLSARPGGLTAPTFLHRVELLAVPVRARRSDSIGPTLYKNVSGVGVAAVEPELVGDVGDPVAVVVDVDLVEHVVAELEEVRAAGGLLQRDVVRDHRHRVRGIRADERVEVGAVGDGILGDFWCFCVEKTLGRPF